MEKVSIGCTDFGDSMNLYKCLNNDNSVTKVSTYKADYIPKKLPEDDEVKVIEPKREKIPFEGISTYKADYTLKELPKRINNKRRTHIRQTSNDSTNTTTYMEDYKAR